MNAICRTCVALIIASIASAFPACSKTATRSGGEELTSRNDASILPPTPKVQFQGTPTETDGKRLRFTSQEAQEELVTQVADGATLTCESDCQEAHYVGDGNGGIKFAYWIIHFRPNDLWCQSPSRIHVLEFVKNDTPMFCGSPPDNNVFYEVTIKEADIVP